MVTTGEANDLTKKTLIHLPEDIGRQDGELIGAVGIVEIAEHILEGLVIQLQPQRECIG
jgi:hypothetical protein